VRGTAFWSFLMIIQSLIDPASLADLAAEADHEGHRMVSRLIAEWLSGENRFDRPGERAYIVSVDGRTCAVCGLNIDPFAADPTVGRVRRLYVSPTMRRRGIASAVIARLVDDAREHFRALHLRTHDANAAAFYEAVGFLPVRDDVHCTHRLGLDPKRDK
jgi:GNAT superfamily N-acetyltransferase